MSNAFIGSLALHLLLPSFLLVISEDSLSLEMDAADEPLLPPYS